MGTEKTVAPGRRLTDATTEFFGTRRVVQVIFTEPADGPGSFFRELADLADARLDGTEPCAVRLAVAAGLYPVMMRVSRQIVTDRRRRATDAEEVLANPRKTGRWVIVGMTRQESDALYDRLVNRLMRRWGESAMGRFDHSPVIVAPLAPFEPIVDVWFASDPVPGKRAAA